MELPVKVPRRPLHELAAHPRVEADGRVVDDRGRREAAIEGRGIDEGLEGRAGLPLRLGGAVELAPLEVVASDHRLDGTVARVQGDERPLQLGVLLQRQLHGLLPLVHAPALGPGSAPPSRNVSAGLASLVHLRLLEGHLAAVPAQLHLDGLGLQLEHGARQDLARSWGVRADAPAATPFRLEGAVPGLLSSSRRPPTRASSAARCILRLSVVYTLRPVL